MPKQLWTTFRTRLLEGFVWNALVVGSSQGSLFAAHLVVARALGISDFGTYALLLSTATAMGSIAQSGIGFVAAKYIAEYHLTDSARTARVVAVCRLAALTLGGVCGLTLVVAAPLIAAHLFDRQELADELRILGCAVPLVALNAYQQGALQGFGAFRPSGLASAAAGVLHVALAWIGAATAGLHGVLLAFLASALLRSLVFAKTVAVVAARYGVVRQPRRYLSEVRLIWRAGLPASLMGVTVAMSFWLVNLIIVNHPRGAEEVGNFFAANQLRLLALQLPTVLSGVAVSVLNRLRGQAEWTSYRSVFFSNLAVSVALASMLIAGAVMFAQPLMSLYGQEFGGSANLVPVLVASILPELVALAIFLHVQAHEKMWLSFCVAWLPKDLIFVAGAALLALGTALGAALAYVVAWTFAAAVFAAIALRIGFAEPRATSAPSVS